MSRHDHHPAWIDLPGTPVTYPASYLELAREAGLDVDALLAEAGLTMAQLADPAQRISLRAFLDLIAAQLAAGGDTSIGFETGLRLPLTAHGNLGYALLCSDTPLAAVDVLQRFWRLRGRGIRFDFEETPEAYVFTFHGELQHLPATLGGVLMEGMVISFCQGVRFLLGLGSFPGEVWFEFPEPAHYARFREQHPYVKYGQAATQVRLADKTRFQHRLGTGNPEALRQAIQLCEREQALLGMQDDHALTTRARAAMILDHGGYPTPATLAAHLHMSLRTLRRRLHSEGSGYKQLLEEARRRDAMVMLVNPALAIQQVATALGYDAPANFTRAFKHWSGHTPSAWRASQAPAATLS